MAKQKIIIWTNGIDDLLEGKGRVGGLTVQMMFWAFAFRKENFETYTFTGINKRNFKGLIFLHFPQKKQLAHISEILYSVFYIVKLRPNIIIFRGASRSLYLLTLLSSLFKIKFIFMGASDVNFIPGKENIAGRDYNTKLYQKGLRRARYVIVQNMEQANLLYSNYQKQSLIIPNIWDSKWKQSEEKDLIVWVGNFRNMKRPDWFIRLAEKFPKQDFVMAGSPSDKNIYIDCSKLADEIPNLTFKGAISFFQSEELFDKAKLLICTSEYEGFPNTFLQAWSRNIPVLSTVDPSNLISEKELGYIIANENELSSQLDRLIKDKDLMNKVQMNISDYFNKSHDPTVHLTKLLKYVK